jgi:cell division septum initiation protein DivIVA
MQTENIKFETVFDAIKHYQTEKGRLEETLRELRQKRSKLDDCAAIATADRMETANWRSKADETLKMIQHRVTQMQTQLSNLRETAERNHEAIRSFHAEVNINHACVSYFNLTWRIPFNLGERNVLLAHYRRHRETKNKKAYICSCQIQQHLSGPPYGPGSLGTA